MSSPHIRLHKITRSYASAAGTFRALHSVSLNVEGGRFIAITGPSGSGKSTLLHTMAGIDRPTSGEVFVGDTAVHDLTEAELGPWRGLHVGVVFQFFELLPTLTAIENVVLPMDFANKGEESERMQRAEALLERMGVVEQAHKFPETMSGGEKQRVAIARALANGPSLIVADEPTGNLDSESTRSVLALFRELVADGTTVVMVTHDHDAASHSDETIALADGRIVGVSS